MQDLRAMAIFAKVIEVGSMQKAADELNIVVSAVSQAITKLEKHYQIRLLNRTTRRLALTEAGELFWQGCVKMLDGALQAEFALENLRDDVRGTVRIALFSSLVNTPPFISALAQIQKQYPELNLDLLIQDEYIDLAVEKIDLAIRSGTNALKDQQFIVRQLLETPLIPVVGKDFFHFLPQHPSELENCILIGDYPNLPSFCFHHASQGDYIFTAKRHLKCDDSLVARQLVLQNLGFGFRVEVEMQQELASGEAIHLFPDWKVVNSPLFLVTTQRILPKKVRVVVDIITKAFQKSQ
ncbi:MAG: LysR family transcriptional regulator [Pasteurellaceae bacterium]|nr:LysR family transcriptional regulator [Pasteurellaceae bacterium]